ncbi:MAG: SAM-dependent chlorinase/fluorinase [Woeseiaceae bacterium]|nr:SAM-dependent chlorinase/fluorinase [Woeseiaceae bacterium]
MKASGVISITTDFGHKGPFAGVMKGVILSRFPAARVVDLGHDIPAHWPPEAGFWLSRSYRYFPDGTVHLAIVDPGVGTDRNILIAERDGHWFLAPDNGLLEPILDLESGGETFILDMDRLGDLDLAAPSHTFHGRDVFAPVAAEIASGRLLPRQIGSATDEWVPGWLEAPEIQPDGRVSGVIITIDTFGNLISNIDAGLIEDMHKPVAQLAGHRFEMRETYGRVAPGDYLALINSFGVVEVARAEQSAALGLGTERGAPIVVIDDPE